MSQDEKVEWTFLSNHAHVLIYLAQNPEARVRDISEAVLITERFAQKILKDLITAGYISAAKQGRRNAYSVNADLNFRHPLENGTQISALLAIFKR